MKASDYAKQLSNDYRKRSDKFMALTLTISASESKDKAKDKTETFGILALYMVCEMVADQFLELAEMIDIDKNSPSV